MNFSEYQKQAIKTSQIPASTNDDVIVPLLGLAGETGELLISCPVEYLHFGGGKAAGAGGWRQKERKG